MDCCGRVFHVLYSDSVLDSSRAPSLEILLAPPLPSASVAVARSMQVSAIVLRYTFAPVPFFLLPVVSLMIYSMGGCRDF